MADPLVLVETLTFTAGALVTLAAACGAAALLWAASAVLALLVDGIGGADRVAHRLRFTAGAAGVGAGQAAALVLLMAALGDGSAHGVAALPLVAAGALAALGAAVQLLTATAADRVARFIGTLAAAVATLMAALLAGLALHAGLPATPLLGALGLACVTGQTVLGWALRREADGGLTPLQRVVHALLVAAAGAAPLALLVALVPALVGGRGWSPPLGLVLLGGAGALAIAGTATVADRRGSRGARRIAATRAAADPATLVDALTGLPDRGGFAAWLAPAIDAALRDRARVALLVVGIDGFKRLNDAFGVRGGDAALVQFARRLREFGAALVLPDGVRLGTLARTGGDEFSLVLCGAPTRELAAEIAARLVAAFAEPVTVDGAEARVGASVGVACAPEDGGIATLQAHAENALRAAKSAGGAGFALFEARIVDAERDRLDLLRDLRRALDARQLELLYQPKIDARSAQVTAAEALLRWNHPTRGVLGPAVFMPLAERYGLIDAIGAWVIDDACRQARRWREAGLKMRVAINVSPLQMRSDGLMQRLLAALRSYGIDPSRLTCEITETAAMEDTAATQRTFAEMGAAGIHVSIDDFGTGYSSLAYLRSLPVAELKIDRAFVRDLGESNNARAIVDAVVKMAHAIGLRVVAEGVETMRQRDVLIELGCDELQGYLFARPMSARALLLWAVDDLPAQHAFRPSLYAETNTPTQPWEPAPA